MAGAEQYASVCAVSKNDDQCDTLFLNDYKLGAIITYVVCGHDVCRRQHLHEKLVTHRRKI